MARELLDLEVEEISSVDHPANRRMYLIVKRNQGAVTTRQVLELAELESNLWEEKWTILDAFRTSMMSIVEHAMPDEVAGLVAQSAIEFAALMTPIMQAMNQVEAIKAQEALDYVTKAATNRELDPVAIAKHAHALVKEGEEMATLEEFQAEVNAKIGSLTEMLEGGASEALQAAQAEVETLKAERDTLTTERDSLTTERDSLKTSESESGTVKTDLEGQIETLKAEVEAQILKNVELTTEIETLKEEEGTPIDEVLKSLPDSARKLFQEEKAAAEAAQRALKHEVEIKEAELEKAETIRKRSLYIKKASDLPEHLGINPETDWPLIKTIEEDAEPAMALLFYKMLSTVDELTSLSKAFEQVSRESDPDGDQDGLSAYEKIETRIDLLRAREPSLDYAEALSRVTRDDQTLYRQHKKEVLVRD